MKDSLAVGLAAARRFEIDRARTIDFMGEELRVYATPMMLRDIEVACMELIGAHLDDGEETVGARVELDHLGAALLGSSVDVHAEIVEIDRRRVVLDVEVRDPVEIVGKARHTRFVIDRPRQSERLAAKRARLAEAGGG